ncbi:Thivi_2564 family membrane protein [Acidicapsa dinghuensis]|uniref:Thivi_2564 family membrane protein n=1 Tax=Acidicapsa dinghuensis TaxID=2218256 RepID=A0ABW1EFF9_9BACT|nr:Thivi_2564 family membrane protein [Acidicapsa dinghuensis]
MLLSLTAVAVATVIDVPLLHILLVLVVVGVLLWLVNNFIPMQSSIKGILNAVVVIVVVLWLLEAFGLLSNLSTIHINR